MNDTTPVAPDFLIRFLEFSAYLFVFSIGLLVLWLAFLYVVDRTQTADAIRHNYPVIGRLRGLFQHLGKFFRQYFFAFDREELPFNRAQREYVYHAARDEDNTIAFGSTRPIHEPGSVLFVNCPYPKLDVESTEPEPVVIGPYCREPFEHACIFNISGMSFGALSKPAVQALSHGAHQAGCWLNTGEGGLSPWHLEGGADLVFQIGTAKYGVRDEYGNLSDDRLREVAAHPQVRMFEIKLSQGAKPGKGGILPAEKVTEEIGRIRGIPPHKPSLSPNRHPEIDSNDDLIGMIRRIRHVTGKPVGFKTVIGAWGWLDALFERINELGAEEAAPDFITIDSADGGSGAAPMTLMDYVGLPLSESLPLVIDRLEAHGLRDRIRVIASGKLTDAGSVAWALCTGADFAVSARGFMFALGCIQALQCHRNTCPTGVTTHDPRLQTGLDPMEKARRVANYARHIEHEVGVIAHSCGVRNPRELRRFHARIVQPDGSSIALDELYDHKRLANRH